MPSSPMPLVRSSPQAQGVDPAAIRALVEAWEARGVRPFGLTVIRHGHVIAEATWAPYRPTDPVQKYSLSKTFTASAIGLAIAEGRFALTDPVASFWPEVGGVGPRARSMTVQHLLSMASGHTEDTLARLDPADPVPSFLRREPEAEPGSVFCYNQGCTMTLSALVQRLSGQPLHDYLRPRLFDPLGIGEVHWLTIGPHDQGFSGLHVPVDALARLGQLLLRRGEFGGRQLLEPSWVDDAMTVHIANGPADPDWSQGYGYQLWRSRHGWRGDGAFGQLCLVLPEYDLVLAAAAQTEQMQPELEAVWEHLLPGLHDEPLPHNGSEAAPAADAVEEQAPTDPALAAFLADRTLPLLVSSAPPVPGRHDLAPSGTAVMPPFGTVRLEVEDSGEATCVLDDGSGPVRVPLGDGRWERTELPLPGGGTSGVAGTGGWTAPGRFEARIVPLHSPHVLLLVADVAAGAAALDWQTEPLGRVTLHRGQT